MTDFEHVYVDSSIIARRTFNQPGALHDVTWGYGVSNELISVELLRSLDNFGLTSRPPDVERAQCRQIVDRNLAQLHLVQLDAMILRRAGSASPTPLGTLDAIHLATALIWVESTGTPLVFLTHDRQLSTAAKASGLDVYPDPRQPV